MNIKRVLLMVPPVTRPTSYGADRMRVSPFFPLGLAYLAAVLRERYEVKVLDCLLEGIERGPQPYGEDAIRYGLRDGDILYQIAKFSPDVVGVSCLFAAQEWDAKNAARLAKGFIREGGPPLTVLGGPHAGANAREIMGSEPAVDRVVIGEGERSFPALLEWEQERASVVDGVAWRCSPEVGDEEGEPHIEIYERGTYIHDLDSIPLPAWDMLDMGRYARLMQPHDRCRQRPFFVASTSRGCPYNCGFCSIRGHWGDVPRFRSADNVLAEIEALVTRYGIREVHFEDDNLTADRGRALALFRGMAERFPGLSWAAPSGLAMRNLDDELLDAMAASGCYSVSLAIESGNQGILRLMRKPVDLARVPGLVQEIQGRGMLCKGFFILGYPGETKATILQTVDFAKSLQLDWAFFFVASPLPHTDMWDQAKAAGMLAEGDWNPLTSMHEPVLRLPGIEPEWLVEVREAAMREICFVRNPNILRNPDQAIADFEHVLALYPHFDFAREALGRAKAREEAAIEQH